MKPSFLTKLEQRKTAANYRRLNQIPVDNIDFFSNDYLGISKDFNLLGLSKFSFSGSTGSRLLSGNSIEAEDCEEFVAQKFKSQAALVYNSGFDANIGLFSSIPQKGDTIIYDEFIHASIRDGVRLSLAKSFSFKHNNVEDLEKKIKLAEGAVFVAVESVYSMNGDLAALPLISSLCNKHGCHLIVDEAHSTGIYGKNGEGLIHELGLENDVFARIITFSKAYGYFGAAVLGSNELKDFLINFSRSFIYSTALPPSYYLCLKNILLLDISERKEKLISNIKLLNPSLLYSPIQIIKSSSVHQLTQLSEKLKEISIYQKPIFSPTVAEGQECIRLCIHSFNTTSQINKLINTFEMFEI